MPSRKSLLTVALCLLFITNTGNAVMCPRLKSVSDSLNEQLNE
jgi:hypothetical protein